MHHITSMSCLVHNVHVMKGFDVQIARRRGGGLYISSLCTACFNEASLDWQSGGGQSDVVRGANRDRRFHTKLGQGQRSPGAECGCRARHLCEMWWEPDLYRRNLGRSSRWNWALSQLNWSQRGSFPENIICFLEFVGNTSPNQCFYLLLFSTLP